MQGAAGQQGLPSGEGEGQCRVQLGSRDCPQVLERGAGVGNS